ncbi:MAG: tetratricopeptide repeat protein, partial [Myxococcales bacterium]|nr:tetratricopeptide repeat protein [Myxococcales bacterium]
AGGNVVLPEAYRGDVGLSLLWSDRAQLPLRYLMTLFWPANLNHIYLTEPLGAGHTALAIASLAVTAALAALGLIGLRRRDPRAALLGIAGALLLPYLHFKPGVVYMADRYLFLIVPFLALLLVDLASRLPLRPPVRIAATAALTITLAGLSLQTHAAWHDPVSLWARMTVVYPQSDWGFDRLGRALYRSHQPEAALAAWIAAAERAPGKGKHLNNAAVAAMALGRDDLARKLLSKALELDPNDALARGNLAKLSPQ